MAAAAQIFVGTVTPLPAVLDAFRSGGGVPYDAYGADLAQGQANFNRPMLMQRLTQEYLPAMPDIHARLLADPPARVADIGIAAEAVSANGGTIVAGPMEIPGDEFSLVASDPAGAAFGLVGSQG